MIDQPSLVLEDRVNTVDMKRLVFTDRANFSFIESWTGCTDLGFFVGAHGFQERCKIMLFLLWFDTSEEFNMSLVGELLLL
jgi:hypothetical protein